jgi:hypothetical protein
MEKINETISKAKNDVKDLIKQFHDKQLEAEPGRTMMESFENRVNQVLSARASFFDYTVLYSFRSLSKAVFGVLV